MPHRVTQRRLLGVGNSGYRYWWREHFAVDANPLPAGTQQDAYGNVYSLTDSAGTLKALAGVVTPVAATTADKDPMFIQTAGVSRKMGRTLIASGGVATSPGNAGTSNIHMGFAWNSTPAVLQAEAMRFGGAVGSTFTMIGTNAQISRALLDTYADGTTYKLAVMLRPTGHYYFINDQLAWVDIAAAQATVYPYLAVRAATARNMTWDYIIGVDLPVADEDFYKLNVSSPSSNTVYSAGFADGAYMLTVTAPGTLANSAELRFRYVDSANYVTAYFDAAGAFKLDTVVAGAATNRVSLAGQITGGGTRTIVVYTSTTKYYPFTWNGTTPAQPGSYTGSVLPAIEAATDVMPVIGAGWSASLLRAWARANTAYSIPLAKAVV